MRMISTVVTLILVFLAPLQSLTFTDCPFHHIQHFERSISSYDSGIDGVLSATFSIIGATHERKYVSITASDNFPGVKFIHNILGFKPLLPKNIFSFDVPSLNTFAETLKEYKVPQHHDILFIEYGLSSWWVLASILKDSIKYRPRVIVAEVNSMLGMREEVTLLF